MSARSAPCARCGTGVPAGARFCPSCGLSASRLSPGQVLDGKYEVLEKIGEGGMGEVYKARHIHLDEIRIIKVTKPDPLGEGAEPRRFTEEARIATRIRHPNVAALYDFSRMPDDSWYMVWEYIDGITLEEWLRRYGPLPAPRAIDVAQQVLAGLEEIHAQGIVHRDLAPDNIMLRESRDGRVLAKIIDLGIAKRVAAETLHHMTSTGMFVGKLKYCSPEQAGALPAGETVDGRSDLYSFGIVLYEMLTGKPPFEAQTPEGYLGKHLHAAPPPLDTARLPELIAPGLASIVRRALEKQRDRRFRDAREFSQALGKLTTGAGDSSSDAPTALLRERSERAGWTWLVGGAIALAAAAAALAFVLHRPAPPSRSSGPATPSPARPTPPPARGDRADEIVIQPRIVEETTPAVPTPKPTSAAAAAAVVPAVTSLPSPRPTSRPAATPTAAAAPPPTAPAPPTVPAAATGPASLDLPGAGELNPRRVRRMVDDWKAKPIEKRAFQAVRVSYLVNQWVKAYPDDALSVELKSTLPRTLREDSDGALAATPPRPGLALEFATGYLQLSFAPRDPEIERRVYDLGQRIRQGPRGRRPNRGGE